MKRKIVFFLTAAVLASVTLFSCNMMGGSDVSWQDLQPNAMVTVKTAYDGSIFFQLDDATRLQPTNLTSHPFGGKEVRAFTNYRTETVIYDGADKVYVNWIDSILTKAPVPFVEGRNDELYGTAPLDIVDDWITVVEDGYITLHLLMEWYDPSIIHRISLLTGGNPADPYEVELRHDMRGDTGGKISDAYVAFLLDGLPDTNGETVKLRLKWNSSRGNRTAEFDYRTRPGTQPQP